MATIVEYVLIGLSLRLLVFPSRLVPVIGMGLLLAICLMLIARPASIFISLLPATALSMREKVLVSWVGLRRAVPIVRATYPLVAKIPQAELIFKENFARSRTSNATSRISSGHHRS